MDFHKLSEGACLVCSEEELIILQGLVGNIVGSGDFRIITDDLYHVIKKGRDNKSASLYIIFTDNFLISSNGLEWVKGDKLW